MKKDIIANNREEIKARLEEIKHIDLRFSIMRLLCFIAMLIFIFISAMISSWFYFVVGALLICFIVLAVIHSKYVYTKTKYELMVGALNNYFDRTNDGFKRFKDNGSEFLDKNAFYQSDLDLFGPSSLYQYLVVAKTPHGRRGLANALKNQQFTNIDERRGAVSALANDYKLSLELEGLSRYYDKNIKQNLSCKALETNLEGLKKEAKLNPLFLIMALLGPFLIIAMLILFLIGITDLRFVILSFILNLGVVYLFNQLYRDNLHTIFSASNTLSSYLCFLSLGDFESNDPMLNELLDTIKSYRVILKNFNRVGSLVNARGNVLVLLLCNGLFLYDVWIQVSYHRWQKKYQGEILPFINTIAQLEELNSLAVIERIKDNSVMPIEGEVISFTNLCHPLLSEDKVIGNDFTLRGLDIITGSNMSGKTTFMRTIGVNMILYSAGAFVCGQSFEGTYMHIFTSMRATDDVNEGISTFYAEIIRIKEMIGFLVCEKKTLILVDEIFKGTNTIDRICGAKSAINRLSKPYVYGIIATHDNELCECVLENYHFEEKYNGDEITFDYKIKDGIAKTTNAKHLMRLAGIIGSDE